MSIRKLIQFFSTFSTVPVEIQDVVDQIVEQYKPVDRIVIKGVDVPETELLGVHYRYMRREGEVLEKVVYIIYSTNAPIEMQRLACCKELIHILDGVPFRTKTKNNVMNLVPRLLTPLNSAPVGVSDLGAFKDRLATYQALAVLFPEEMREECHAEFNKGNITIAKIAQDTCLPEVMIATMLSDEWLPLASDFLDV